MKKHKNLQHQITLRNLASFEVIQKQSFRLKISPYFAVIPQGKRKTEEDTLEESAFMLEKTLMHHSKNFILSLRKLFSSFVFTQKFKISFYLRFTVNQTIEAMGIYQQQMILSPRSMD